MVEEATNVGSYAAAHLYTDEAIRRAVECGVHSLEHCNLITLETARLAAKAGCIACPTLITYDKLLSGSIGAKATNKLSGPPRYDFMECWHGAGWARPRLPSNSRYRERITPTRSVKVKKPLLMKSPMDEKSWIRQRASAKECVVRKTAPHRG